MKMAFSRDVILSLDPEQYSASDRKSLLERFFPTMQLPDWQQKLSKDWPERRRWDAYCGGNPFGAEGKPYRHTSDHLIDRATFFPPKIRGNRVTDFTGWIYSLYQEKADRKALENGKAVERQVAAKLVTVPKNSDWELICQDPLDESADIKQISSLMVNGKPLRGVPDLAFRSKRDDTVLIIERKASNREIPSDGWPNLRAQLWAYAHIDDWLDAREIILIGEIWGFTQSRPNLRKVLRWSIKDKNFYAPNANLFDKYRED